MSALALRPLAGAMAVLLAAACGGEDFQSDDDGVKDASGAGSGGKSGSGGSGTGGGSAANGGSAGTSGDGGSGGAGTAGVSAGGSAGNAQGGSGTVDASVDGSAGLGGLGGGGTDASDGAIHDAATCDAPIVYYRDQDGDQYGARNSDRASCTALGDGWTDQSLDCNDERADVNPSIDAFSGVPYGSGATASFDYDCDGVEEPDPSQFGAAVTCPQLALGACNKKGFAPTSRSGPNVNPYCGSTALVTCVPNGLNCTTNVSQVAPKRCR